MDRSQPPTNDQIIVVAALAFAMCVVLANFWLCDDAFITLRVVDNFFEGHGLRWNVFERVQAYTHPLWLFLLSFIGGLTGLHAGTFLIASLLCFLAIVHFILKYARLPEQKLFFLLILSVTKPVIDFFSSGLENPLSYLLLLLVYCEVAYSSAPLVFRRRLFLWEALLFLTRPDNVLIILPIIAYAAYSTRSVTGIKNALIGLTPFILWELFSVIYYGTFLPNTAYAKLNTNLPRLELVSQGLVYFKSLILISPISVILLTISIYLSLKSAERLRQAIGLGLLLHTAYVIFIGGDFMVGRFFANSIFLSLVIVTFHLASLPHTTRKRLLVLLLAIGVLTEKNPWTEGFSEKEFSAFPNKAAEAGKTKLIDEKNYYKRIMGIREWTRQTNLPASDHKYVKEGSHFKDRKGTYQKEAIGVRGYYAGPEVVILDAYALADPLLARLPATSNWRIGHFRRKIPSGYLETLRTGQNSIKNQDLAQYYEIIKTLSQAELFSLNRVNVIARFHMGYYDHLRERYLAGLD